MIPPDAVTVSGHDEWTPQMIKACIYKRITKS
jgi:hypothetical protein